MEKKDVKIGVALSGGGIRATVFHLGLFKWLAENGLMENIKHISSVSGASIAVGLIYTCNNMKWPKSKEYLENVLPKLKTIILKEDVQNKTLVTSLKKPWKLFGSKSNILAEAMEKCWDIKGTFGELPAYPAWSVNCTTFETGKNFRFSQKFSGDYKLGYFDSKNFPLVNAIASSAGFPFLIGMYKLDTRKYSWYDYGSEHKKILEHDHIHLWDGGVYDNLGLEAIYKMGNGGACRKGVDFCIVSNASAGSADFTESGRSILEKLGDTKRLLDIAMDQIGALRSREYMAFITEKKTGMYIQIGNSAEKITSNGTLDKKVKEELLKKCLKEEECHKVKTYKTTLNKPSEKDYDLILRHGYENAKCVYSSYDSILK